MKQKVGADLSSLIFGDFDAAKAAESRSTAVTHDEALNLGKRFARLVHEQFDNDALVFLFGSAIKGLADVNSDVDVAVVSKKFDADFIREAGRISSLAQSVHEDIEVHAVSDTEWRKGNPHVWEIQRGIAI